MISHQFKCIFIHIPKCAGTSFEEALGHFTGHEGRKGQDHRSVRMIQKPFPMLDSISSVGNIKDTLRRFREYGRKHANPNNALQVTAEQYKSYFKFTVVRHPVDRAVSWYKNAMRDPIQQRNYSIQPDIDFDTFMRNFAGTGFLRPQTYWLQEYSGRINMDLVIKFEELSEGYTKVCKQLNIDNLALPHKIDGGKVAKPMIIADSTIQFIRDFYSKEFELFGYN